MQTNTFTPAFGLSNCHLQTLYSTFFRKNIKLNLSNEIFTLSDDDFLEYSWCNKPTNSTTPIVLLLHGLEGSINSPYIRGMMKTLEENNISSVLMHFRGCGTKDNKKANSYHSGQTSDVKEFIEYIKNIYKENDLYCIGYSMGGNILLKLLGEYKDNSPIKKAVSISAPILLDNSSKTIHKGFSRIYEKHLLKNLIIHLGKKYLKHDMEKIIGIKKKDIKNIKSIWEFDDVYTAKVNGFKTASNYYKLSSSKQYLKDIKTKTLIIHALDDPFMTKEILPLKKDIPSNITLCLSKNGGHVGFIGGTIINPIYWLEKEIVSFFKN
ncbi:MAG TPA: hydrolase [Arcobacter sp.]|nr:hydrolase [Arcobacter sp.]HIP55440.1 hydrolase [Arcobacter sp.]